VQRVLAEIRKTPAPVHVDKRAAFAIRVLMGQRGLSPQRLADAMFLAGIEDAPCRSTISRIIREGAEPHEGNKRALAEFFYGPGADPTRIWKVRRG
jgi:hypothetical protein